MRSTRSSRRPSPLRSQLGPHIVRVRRPPRRPLANLALSAGDFADLAVRAQALVTGPGRVVVVLEVVTTWVPSGPARGGGGGPAGEGYRPEPATSGGPGPTPSKGPGGCAQSWARAADGSLKGTASAGTRRRNRRRLGRSGPRRLERGHPGYLGRALDEGHDMEHLGRGRPDGHHPWLARRAAPRSWRRPRRSCPPRPTRTWRTRRNGRPHRRTS